MNKATGFLIFVVGAAMGSIIIWQYAKKKYEQIAQEEIDSVKEVFSKRDSDTEITINSAEYQTVRVEKMTEKPDISEYSERMQKGYTNYSDFKTNKKEQESLKQRGSLSQKGWIITMSDRPYVISPEEFGENEDYERISLTYYSDQVLADENDELIEDADDVVGMEALTHFGEYEDDSVFVRNDRLKCDYEILMDQGTYSDAIKKKPHRTEVR